MERTTSGARAKLGVALWGTDSALALAKHAALAEEIGLESAWIIDSQLLCRDVYVTLAACVAATTRIRLATGVTQPTTRHSSVTASAIASLHEMAPGRMMLGLGTGFSSLRTIGKRAATVDAVEAYTNTLRRLLDAQPAQFDDGVEAQLSWLRDPTGIPIHLAASGPRMTRSAGRIGDGAILLQGVAPEMLDRAIAWLDEGIAASGRPRGSVEISCWVPFSYDINPAGARDRVRTRVASAVVQANPDWFKDDERLAIEAIKRDYDVADHAQAVAAHADLVPDSLVRKFAIAGDGEDIRIQLDALRRHPRLTRVILTPQASSDGTSSMADVLRQLGDITPLND